VLLYLLLRDHLEGLALAIIDPEYPGFEPVIKNRILTLCLRQGVKVYKDHLTFQLVGKKSPAHDLAIKVFKGKALPDQEISAEEVLAEFGE